MKPLPVERNVVATGMKLADGHPSGLATSILNEARCPRRPFSILSMDDAAFDIHSTKVIPGSPGTPITPPLQTEWNGQWMLLHDNAYISPHVGNEVINEMYKAASSADAPGSFECLERFSSHLIGQGGQGSRYYARFSNAFERFKAGTTVHMQGFSFEPAIHNFADILHRRGCKLSLVMHEAISPNLYRSPWGRSLLEAFSKCDALVVHTDAFRRSVLRQMHELNLEAPYISRFDLPVNVGKITNSEAITKDNYTSSIPNYHLLNEGQKAFLDEVFSTQARVPHRFFCADRADPIKGGVILLDAITEILESERMKGKNLSDLQKLYRFFFMTSLGKRDLVVIGKDDQRPMDLNPGYEKLFGRKLLNLKERFPKVIFQCDALYGDSSVALHAVQRHCHTISGSIQEGLNLLVQEGAVAAQDSNTGILLGRGAGFASQAIEDGWAHTGFFPESGNIPDWIAGIRTLVELQKQPHNILAAKKGLLIQHAILSRRSSIMPNVPGAKSA